jgi:hypothetical protein
MAQVEALGSNSQYSRKRKKRKSGRMGMLSKGEDERGISLIRKRKVFAHLSRPPLITQPLRRVRNSSSCLASHMASNRSLGLPGLSSLLRKLRGSDEGLWG